MRMARSTPCDGVGGAGGSEGCVTCRATQLQPSASAPPTVERRHVQEETDGVRENEEINSEIRAERSGQDGGRWRQRCSSTYFTYGHVQKPVACFRHNLQPYLKVPKLSNAFITKVLENAIPKLTCTPSACKRLAIRDESSKSGSNLETNCVKMLVDASLMSSCERGRFQLTRKRLLTTRMATSITWAATSKVEGNLDSMSSEAAAGDMRGLVALSSSLSPR